MIYNISSDQLSNRLKFDTLKRLSRLFPIDKYCVIGATARDLLCQMMNASLPQRKTMDLDICIAVDDWMQFDEISSILKENGFKEDAQKKHRFYYGGSEEAEYMVDVVPYGSISKDGDYIYWPPDDNPRMSVRGFKECIMHSITVSVDNGLLSFRIPSVPGLFLFKLDAWVDRHDRTDKDAYDMMVLMRNFQSHYCTDDSFTPVYDFLHEDEYDVCVVGAAMIAYGICAMIDKKHLMVFKENVDEQLKREESSALIQQCMDSSRDIDYPVVKKSWSVFSKVLGNACDN